MQISELKEVELLSEITQGDSEEDRKEAFTSAEVTYTCCLDFICNLCQCKFWKRVVQ